MYFDKREATGTSTAVALCSCKHMLLSACIADWAGHAGHASCCVTLRHESGNSPHGALLTGVYMDHPLANNLVFGTEAEEGVTLPPPYIHWQLNPHQIEA